MRLRKSSALKLGVVAVVAAMLAIPASGQSASKASPQQNFGFLFDPHIESALSIEIPSGIWW